MFSISKSWKKLGVRNVDSGGKDRTVADGIINLGLLSGGITSGYSFPPVSIVIAIGSSLAYMSK